jgi:integrase
MLAYLSTTRHPERNRVIFLMSVKAGLRAKEIAKLTWWMMTNDSPGQIGWDILRTFITNAARKISTIGGSLKDVQELAGHANLWTTQGYIDANPEAQVRIVGLV